MMDNLHETPYWSALKQILDPCFFCDYLIYTQHRLDEKGDFHSYRWRGLGNFVYPKYHIWHPYKFPSHYLREKRTFVPLYAVKYEFQGNYREVLSRYNESRWIHFECVFELLKSSIEFI